MRLPEIRYPLFWIVGAVLLGVLAWRGWPWTEPLRDTFQARWTRAVAGPPVPCSAEPKIWSGPLPRRALLLRDGLVAADRPDGAPVETIGRRMFVDIYDVWPLAGPPTHYRVGNRRPFGWLPAASALPWDSRLVLRDPAADAPARPVLAWDADRVRMALWDAAAPWSKVEREQWQPRPAAGTPAQLVSRPELLALLRRLLGEEPAEAVRVRTLLGHLLEARPVSAAVRDAAHRVLPPWVFAAAAPSRDEAIARLSRRNEQWTPDASWSGLEFVTLPLADLP